ncbi:MAG: 2-oxoacid:acceptor oxidoreductase family protein [Candidatus Lokiarchaeota archaeon]|nr:2-oxoacid:acceptor oxidoreductase family protein [Candidatus Lokiarchaeota archaeon]
MNFDSYTIVVTGLGGQGLIRFLQILGNALMIKGYKVMTSETHGLSQRGGKVSCFLRFGNKLLAPIPMIGSADIILSLEESSILDVLFYAKPDKSTNLIISTYEKPQIDTKYPSLEYLLSVLYENSENIYFIPVSEIAVKHTGNLKAMNSVILGYILKFLPLDGKDLEESLIQHFSEKNLELNLKAFREGQKLQSILSENE